MIVYIEYDCWMWRTEFQGCLVGCCEGRGEQAAGRHPGFAWRVEPSASRLGGSRTRRLERAFLFVHRPVRHLESDDLRFVSDPLAATQVFPQLVLQEALSAALKTSICLCQTIGFPFNPKCWPYSRLCAFLYCSELL